MIQGFITAQHVVSKPANLLKTFFKLVNAYLYCCTVHLVDSLIITQPTNALIVCHLLVV